eukprot:comp18765_c0_seq1/m.34139 comp18765_c0_seq1/g.34139  ORF comp18765_c0_seq1/g.34139 comp18765_c0_seq1/m.34139 type:complete len:272 (-) comp18765_c0_seq1:47-862(-)
MISSFVLTRSFARAAGSGAVLPFPNKAATLASKLSLSFNDSSLIEEALTHASFRSGADATARTNERLSLLGSHLLNSMVAEHVFVRHPNMPGSGIYASVSKLTSHQNLANVARKLGLLDTVRWVSDKTALQGDAKKVFAKSIHALVAAIHVDQGAEAARGFVHQHILVDTPVSIPQISKHPKVAVNELLIGMNMAPAAYKLVREAGRGSHAPVFVVGLFSDEKLLAEGAASSIHRAEQQAAIQYLSHHYAKISEKPLPDISRTPQAPAASQ